MGLPSVRPPPFQGSLFSMGSVLSVAFMEVLLVRVARVATDECHVDHRRCALRRGDLSEACGCL
jgi:hypothetical protein